MRALIWDSRRSLLTAALAGFRRTVGEIGAIMIVVGNVDHVTRVLTLVRPWRSFAAIFDRPLRINFAAVVSAQHDTSSSRSATHFLNICF